MYIRNGCAALGSYQPFQPVRQQAQDRPFSLPATSRARNSLSTLKSKASFSSQQARQWRARADSRPVPRESASRDATPGTGLSEPSGTG